MKQGHSGRGVTQALCSFFFFFFNFSPLSFRCFWMFNASTFTDWSSSIFFIFTFKSKKSAGLPLIFSLWCSGVLLHIHQKAGGPRLWRIHGGNGVLPSPEVSLLFSAGLWGHVRQATDSSSGNLHHCFRKCGLGKEGGRIVLLFGTQRNFLIPQWTSGLNLRKDPEQGWLTEPLLNPWLTENVRDNKWLLMF